MSKGALSSLWSIDLTPMNKISNGPFNNSEILGMTWSEVNTFGAHPGPLSHHTSVVFGDKMYLYGGSKGNCDSNDLMYALDLKTFRWEVID